MDIIINPHLLPERLNAQLYHSSLIAVLPHLHDVPLAVRERVWFKYDKAQVHYVKWLTVTTRKRDGM
jgi:hypothetical protein